MTITERVRSLWQRSKTFLRNFNAFESEPPTADQYERQNQNISTKLFIVLLTLILTVLLLYTSLVTVTKTVNVKAPTVAYYSQLYATYPQTLTCACTKISINYEKFLHVDYSLHQVCSSIFVTNNWIDYLASSYEIHKVNIYDFRATSSHAFEALSAFCEVTQTTISDSLNRFYASQYVSASVTPSDLLQSQVQSFTLQFISSTTNTFLAFLNMIRSTTQDNGLISALRSNYDIFIPDGYTFLIAVPSSFSGCSCGVSAMCTYQSPIYDYPNTAVLFTVPNFYSGCYVIESLLQSTLQCFYNQTCIDQLISYFASPLFMNITALQPSMSSQYFTNSTIQNLIDHLMVEQWNSSSMYDNYYNECQPAQCTYTYQTRNDLIYIITTLIGLVGGLITVLKLVIPRVVNIFVRYILKRRRIFPGIPMIQV
jgi:hypothetical protein